MNDSFASESSIKQSVKRKIIDWINEHIVIGTIILMCFLALPEISMLVGYNILPEKITYPDKVASVLFSLCIAIFTGVLFSAVTKSDHFMKIYKEILEDIIKNWRKDDIKDKASLLQGIKSEMVEEVGDIFSEGIESIYTDKNREFLKRLSTEQQLKIWNNLSDVILENSFPKINDAIKNYVLKTYFPKKDSFYYSDYHVTLDYTLSDIEKKIISIRDERYYKLIPAKGSTELKHEICNTIETDKLINYKWDLLNVNGNQYGIGEHCISNGTLKMGIDEDIDYDRKKITKSYYTLNKVVQKDEEIIIHAIIIREFHLAPETSILNVSFKKFVENMHVQIKYDTKLSVEFTKIGLLGDFVDRGVTTGLINKEFNNIVFPGQGFMVSIGIE